MNVSAKRGRAPAHEQTALEEAEKLLLPVPFGLVPAGLALGRVEVRLGARESGTESTTVGTIRRYEEKERLRE